MFALDDFEGADPAADVDACSLSACGGDFESGLLDGELRCGEGELDEAAHLFDVFAVDEVFGVEVFDLAGDAGGVGGGVEEGDGSYAGLALPDGLPGLFCSDSYRAYEAYSGDYDAAFLGHVRVAHWPFAL